MASMLSKLNKVKNSLGTVWKKKNNRNLFVNIVKKKDCQDTKARRDPVVMKYKSNVTFDCSRLKSPEFYHSKDGKEEKYEGNENNVKIEDGKLTLFDISKHV